MKKSTIFILLLMIVKSSFAQWTVVNSGSTHYMYYDSTGAKVGIGNSAPKNFLDVGNATLSTFSPNLTGQVLGATVRTLVNGSGLRVGSLFYTDQTGSNTSATPNSSIVSYMATSNSGSASNGTANSILANYEHRSGGVVDWAHGVYAEGFMAGAGNMNHWAGFRSRGVTIKGGGSGTVQNGYGIYIDTFPSFVTNKWAVFAPDPNATSEFGGQVYINSGGSFRFQPGAGANKVLTSDSSGNASWQTPASAINPADFWNINGNAGTVDGTNFIGTTDAVPLNLRVNGIAAGRINLNNDIFLGLRAGGPSVTGIGDNVAVGADAMTSVTNVGWGNVAVGSQVMQSNNASYFSVAIGYQTMLSGYGDGNTIVGAQAGFTGPGGGNTGIGYSSLNAITTGTGNSAFGMNADVSTGNFTNSTALGRSAIVTASNKVRIGDNNVTIVAIPPGASLINDSDKRFKSNIKAEDVKGLDFINRLRPVVYNFDTKKITEYQTQNMPAEQRKKYLEEDFSKSSAIRISGFIAQEVEQAADESGYNFSAIHKPENNTDSYGLAYSQFVVPLVKAVQELSKQNDELKSEIENLKTLISGTTEGAVKLSGANASAKLFQNEPNPFTETTVIRYTIPAAAKTAVLKITSANGTPFKQFDLKRSNAQAIEIAGGQLKAGTYVYSLVIDDVVTDSKQMVLTK